ncbi:MAG TPA: hypothetical protein VIN38_00760 [Thiobacillus sp.]
MINARHFFSCAVLACVSGWTTQVYASDPPGLIGQKISFAPMPVEMHLQPNERPAMITALPCAAVNKMTMGFPPVAAFESLMFQMVAIMNNINMMPMRFEPVCS